MTQALFSRTVVYFERPGHAQTGLVGVEWVQVALGQPLIPAPMGWVTVPSQGLTIKARAFTLEVVDRREVLAGSLRMRTQVIFPLHCGNSAALKRVWPSVSGSLQVPNHVSACGLFSLFHLGVPFLVSTIKAFPETLSFFCYLTQKEELGADDSHGNGCSHGKRADRGRKFLSFLIPHLTQESNCPIRIPLYKYKCFMIHLPKPQGG